MGTIVVPKYFWKTNFDVKAFNLDITLLVWNLYEIWYYFEFRVLSWIFNEFKIFFLLRFEVMKKYQAPKECSILHIFHITSVIWNLEALTSKFAFQKYLGTTMVPILLWESPYSSTFFNVQYINGAHKCDITTKRGTPVVPKNGFSKNINSELSNAVSIVCIVILDQKLLPIQCSWFFDISSNLEKYQFSLKFMKKSSIFIRMPKITQTS